MVMDGQGYCDIHGYCDRGVCTVVSIHGWSWIVKATVTSMDTVTEGYAQWSIIHGWSWMVKATVTSMNTMTEGYAQWCPPMDGHAYSIIRQKNFKAHVRIYSSVYILT